MQTCRTGIMVGKFAKTRSWAQTLQCAFQAVAGHVLLMSQRAGVKTTSACRPSVQEASTHAVQSSTRQKRTVVNAVRTRMVTAAPMLAWIVRTGIMAGANVAMKTWDQTHPCASQAAAGHVLPTSRRAGVRVRNACRPMELEAFMHVGKSSIAPRIIVVRVAVASHRSPPQRAVLAKVAAERIGLRIHVSARMSA